MGTRQAPRCQRRSRRPSSALSGVLRDRRPERLAPCRRTPSTVWGFSPVRSPMSTRRERWGFRLRLHRVLLPCAWRQSGSVPWKSHGPTCARSVRVADVGHRRVGPAPTSATADRRVRAQISTGLAVAGLAPTGVLSWPWWHDQPPAASSSSSAVEHAVLSRSVADASAPDVCALHPDCLAGCGRRCAGGCHSPFLPSSAYRCDGAAASCSWPCAWVSQAGLCRRIPRRTPPARSRSQRSPVAGHRFTDGGAFARCLRRRFAVQPCSRLAVQQHGLSRPRRLCSSSGLRAGGSRSRSRLLSRLIGLVNTWVHATHQRLPDPRRHRAEPRAGSACCWSARRFPI